MISVFSFFWSEKKALAGRKQLTFTNQLVGNPEHKVYILDLRLFENYFIKAIEHFFHVYIASSKHSVAERILENYKNCHEFSKPPCV